MTQPTVLDTLISGTRRVWRAVAPSDGYIMLLGAACVGIVGALVTLAFRQGISGLQWVLVGHSGSLVAMAATLPWYARIALPTGGSLVAGGLLVWANQYDRGTPADYMETVAFGDGVIPVRHTLLRSLSSLVTIASGGSIGREGAMVQLAALGASVLGRVVRVDPPQFRLLVACGAAAGITAAYNAPLAGALFVAEIVLGGIVMEAFGPLVIAAIGANLTMRALPDYQPTYTMPAFPAVSDAEMVAFAGLGLLAGLTTPQFLRLLDFARTRFQQTGWPVPVRLAVGGGAVGVLSVGVPQVWGNGYEVVNALLHDPWPWTAVLAVLLFKVAATMCTAGSGAVGGAFTPTLFVGAASGFLFGQAVGAVWPGASAPFAYAIAGMGAFLAVATHAPLMAIVMIFEMTWSAPALLPLTVSCIVAYFVALPRNRRALYRVTLEHRRDLETRGRLRQLRVGDLIQPADTVLPLTAPLAALARMLGEHAVKYLYIVNDRNWFCGVVTAQDITAALADRRDTTALTAADLLHQDFAVLLEDQPLGDALPVFLRHPGERLPVVPSRQEPILLGVVYKTALLETYYRLQQPLI